MSGETAFLTFCHRKYYKPIAKPLYNSFNHLYSTKLRLWNCPLESNMHC